MHFSKLWKRLAPLYVSGFFEGLVFWYTIGKVFMVHIGFDATTIALDVVVISVVSLSLNIPSGLMADRWSRKGVLLVAYIALGLASLFMGLANGVLGYILATVLYGMSAAFRSGVNDAMIYDTLIEENGTREGYEKYLGYSQLFAGVALVTSSLLGGVIGEKVGLSAAYFYSIPGALCSIVSLFMFREPKLHKQQLYVPIVSHLKATMVVLFQKSYLVWIVIVLLSTAVVYSFLLQVDQLWPLALKLGIIWYGPLNALLLMGYSLGAPLASFLLRKRSLIAAACLLAILSVLLLMIQSMPIIALAQFGVICLFIALNTIALGKLHDALPSKLRSVSSSTVSTLGALAFIPSLFIFSGIVQHYSVFIAARMLIPIALIGILGVFFVLRQANTETGEEDK